MTRSTTHPAEHKAIQARILHYAKETGWTYVLRDEVGQRCGFDPAGATPEERARKASLCFIDLIDQFMVTQLYVHAR
jgi:type I restriction enzyme R subunit